MVRKAFNRVSSLIFILSWGAAAAASPSEDISVELQASNVFPTIGDSLTVTCSVTVPEGFTAGEPSFPEKTPFIDIERVGEKEKAPVSGAVEREYDYLAYVLSPDTLLIGPVRVEFVSADGDTGSVESNVITLVVNGVIASVDSIPEPMANRGPFKIASRGIPLWAAAVAFLLLLAAVAAVLYFLRKRKTPAVPAAPPEPIDEIREFERIKELRLHEKGKIRELYIMVSNAMRGFLHRNLEFDALYETTEEILDRLSRDSVDDVTYEKIREIFHESDMVKFAKYVPAPELCSTVVDRALVPVRTILDRIERERARRAAENGSAGEREAVTETARETPGGGS